MKPFPSALPPEQGLSLLRDRHVVGSVPTGAPAPSARAARRRRPETEGRRRARPFKLTGRAADVRFVTVRRGAAALQICAAAGLALFALHTLVADPAGVAAWMDNRLYYALELAAVALCGGRALFIRRNRIGWLALTLGVASFAAGDLAWAFWIAGLENPPYPSIADALYLGFYPAAYVALVLLFRAYVRGATGGLWLDGVASLLATAALGSAVLVEAVLETTGGSFSAVATNLAYPLGDVMLLALVLGTFVVTRWQAGRAWLLIGASLAVFGLTDSVYLFQTAKGTYSEGTLLDTGWPAALLLLGFAAWRDDRAGKVDVGGRPLLLVPATAAAVAIAVLLVDHFDRVNLFALFLATAALVVVVARLGLTFSENRRLLELSRHEAITDPLTGLANRRKLLDDLGRRLEVGTPEEPWLLALYDLDGFKSYNDAFGHPAGDTLLIRVGHRLAEVPGAEGRAYRLGGDEFCLLAPGWGGAAERLLDLSVRALEERGEGFEISSSFGAVLLPVDAREPREALRLADARLYAQKHQNRARRDRPHEVLLQALYERGAEMHTQLQDVAALVDRVGRVLGLTDGELDELHLAAQLHDIGKLAIPDEVLLKRGPLDDDERRFVEQHTIVGERILCASPALRGPGLIVRSTHERWDGTGYPDGLTGDETPIAARIIFACDAYDAMMTTRPYRPAMSAEQALDELKRCAGTQFDPQVVDALVQILADVRRTLAS
jgi:two-component system cell cycle response regulator